MSIAQASRAIIELADLVARIRAGREELFETLVPGVPLFARRGFRAILEATLLSSEPFFVGREAQILITAAMATIPNWSLRPEDFPTPVGFVWLSGELKVEEYVLRAITWAGIQRTGKEYDVSTLQAPVLGAPKGIRLVFWVAPPGVSAPVSSSSICIDFGEGILDAMGRASADENGQRRAVSHIQFFASFLAFIQQRVLRRERHPADRAARKIAQRSELLPRDVTVVLLRHSLSVREGGANEGAHWSCRWFVEPHWRRQPCGAGRQLRRPVFVNRYLKGPGDKPIRASRRLFSVSR